MAGLGRRSHYRKHLTDAVLNDFPEPKENECIAKVVATRGSNQFDVLVPLHGTQLAILPSKFNKLIWVKRGDYCIVETGNDATEDTNGGVRFIITHILYKEQIKHLKSKKLWPNSKEFETETNEDREEEAKWTSGEEDEEENEDGIVFDTAVNADEYFVNTNRINAMQIQDSSESESSDDDLDTQQNGTDDVIEFDTQDDELFANTNRVAALRIQESESDSSVEEGKIQRNEGNLQRGESIEFDTGNGRNMSHLTAMQMRAEGGDGNCQRGESIEFDTGTNVRSMSDGLIYDTADAEEIEEPEGESDDDDEMEGIDNNCQRGESSEFDTGTKNVRNMSDGLIYDTADTEEIEEPEGESDDDDEDSIHQEETDDGLVYDTADADEVDPDSNEESDESDDDKKPDINKTETDDGVEYDTANDAKQESDHNVV